MDFVASRTPCTFQQVSTPAHKAKLVQSWLKKNVSNFWDFNTWPPNNPDLTPCDYYMCAPHTIYQVRDGQAGSCRGLHSLWEVQASFGGHPRG
ncbi:Uncharacterized protein FKW44_014552 [Caligus rogercresseyi]|uniref:Uncharacterized protein n=1 Tax=Caligus rogercresseyi TaxID=217165 RepID=A0A7T8GZC0_CALRO|nr:Uncharacterized protein FKW44_014552 [Caligus rogercresseyi]